MFQFLQYFHSVCFCLFFCVFIAFLFVQNISMSFFPVLVRDIPWTLAIPANGAANPSIAMNLMAGIEVPSFMPLYVALIAIFLFAGPALSIFERQEFWLPTYQLNILFG
jgi:hypothetical protein